MIVQELAAPGIEGALTQRLFLPDHADWIECTSWWQMGLSTHPQATYLLFPFHLASATPRFDVGAQPVIPGDEQLPGSCRDYFTVQGWVDFSNQHRGVTGYVAIRKNFTVGGNDSPRTRPQGLESPTSRFRCDQLHG